MAREMIRHGGRSARIQNEVHAATRALLEVTDRSELTVPMIAERAGVPPSTIYRRWGDLSQLLADVAVERLRPIADPDDTGATMGDLEAFVVQYAEEMSSAVGRRLLRDVLADAENETSATKCCRFTYDHLEVIAGRAVARGEPGIDIGLVIDRVIAPIVYHILFRDRDVEPDYCRQLLATVEVGGLRTAA
ncbi:MAG: TetR/AcrR family transcriptional regulator [Ancalomicrobiaceae bacterium]|nr:TetR/AcrR family transcriptional regulator [Ancalomicrobiaceae bacterium]